MLGLSQSHVCSLWDISRDRGGYRIQLTRVGGKLSRKRMPNFGSLWIPSDRDSPGQNGFRVEVRGTTHQLWSDGHRCRYATDKVLPGKADKQDPQDRQGRHSNQQGQEYPTNEQFSNVIGIKAKSEQQPSE